MTGEIKVPRLASMPDAMTVGGTATARAEKKVPSLAAMPDAMTVPEVALVLRRGRNQVYKLIREGDLWAVKLGNRLLVPKTAVRQLLETGSAKRLTSATPPRPTLALLKEAGL